MRFVNLDRYVLKAYRTLIAVLRIVILLLCAAASSRTILAQQPLAETTLLSDTGDIASVMIDGIDRFLLEQIQSTARQRHERWKQVAGSLPANSGNLSKTTLLDSNFRTEKREQLSRIIGVVDPRVPFAQIDILKTTSHSGCVAAGVIPASHESGAEQVIWQAQVVRWPVLDGVYGEGLLLEPVAPQSPVHQVVIVPDAQQTPEQIAGLAPGCPEELQYAKRLADSGCRVIIPMLVSYRTERRGPPGQPGRVELSNREFVYRPAFEMGRHIVGYEVQKILAIVDWFTKNTASNAAASDPGQQASNSQVSLTSGNSIFVVGYGEGGLLALLSTALDDRIDATYVSGYFGPRERLWQEPIARNLFGLLTEFGDAELAALVHPRILVVDFATGPSLTLRTQGGAPGDLLPRARKSIVAELQRATELLRITWDTHEAETSRVNATSSSVDQIQYALLSKNSASWIYDNSKPKMVPEPFDRLVRSAAQSSRIDLRDPLPDSIAREERQVQELIGHTQHLLNTSWQVRQQFMSQVDTQSVAAYQQSLKPYQQKFSDEIIGAFELPLLPANARTRRSWQNDKWNGYEVMLDVWPDVVAYGVLLVPKNISHDQRRPVVVCQHGLEGRPTDVFLGDHPAYHDFAASLCNQGYIVFAPQNIYLFEDRFRTLQRKANSIGKTLFSIMIPQHQQFVDWLQTLPFVDADRIAFYGLSYGGKSAMRIPALVPDYCLSICSADFNEWILKNASTSHPFSYVWTGEYEIFEFNLGNTFNYSEMAALICPRPFMVERGHFDAVGTDEWVAHEYAKVQRLYKAQLGLGDRVEIEWFNGPHTIHGQGTFAFLAKHLQFPPEVGQPPSKQQPAPFQSDRLQQK